MINLIPDEKLPSIGDLLIRIYEEEQIDQNEAAEVDAAKKRIADGNYASFEDVFGQVQICV